MPIFCASVYFRSSRFFDSMFLRLSIASVPSFWLILLKSGTFLLAVDLFRAFMVRLLYLSSLGPQHDGVDALPIYGVGALGLISIYSLLILMMYLSASPLVIFIGIGPRFTLDSTLGYDR